MMQRWMHVPWGSMHFDGHVEYSVAQRREQDSFSLDLYRHGTFSAKERT